MVFVASCAFAQSEARVYSLVEREALQNVRVEGWLLLDDKNDRVMSIEEALAATPEFAVYTGKTGVTQLPDTFSEEAPFVLRFSLEGYEIMYHHHLAAATSVIEVPMWSSRLSSSEYSAYAAFWDAEVRHPLLNEQHGDYPGPQPYEPEAFTGNCDYAPPGEVFVDNLIDGYNSYGCPSNGFTGNIPTDDFFAGVIQAEMGSFFPFEALKAQSVAARTFGLWRLSAGSGANCGQAYSSNISATCLEASYATSGQVILYNGSLIQALYSARCNGVKTQNANQGSYSPSPNCSTSGNALPYCVCRDCSGHIDCTIAGEGDCCEIPNSCGSSGHVFGHGVGLCQRGAQGFANDGLDYMTILDNFYTSVCITESLAGDNPNDEACESLTLTVEEVCNFATLSNTLATGSPTAPPDCAGDPTVGYGGGDVWASFIAPVESVIIEFDLVAGSDLTDPVLAVYSADDCNEVSQLVACDDDSGPGFLPFLELDGLTPGSTYYLRIWEFNNNSFGEVDVCVWTQESLVCEPSGLQVSQAACQDDGNGLLPVINMQFSLSGSCLVETLCYKTEDAADYTCIDLIAEGIQIGDGESVNLSDTAPDTLYYIYYTTSTGSISEEVVFNNGNCGFICDCDGQSIPISVLAWLGDGIGDDNSFEYFGIPVNFNCESWGFDCGDFGISDDPNGVCSGSFPPGNGCIDLSGCTDPQACNYSAEALDDDGSCVYSAECAGDLNNDGEIGIADLLLFLTLYGNSCPQ